ncbi:hypothetical protein [Limnoglobus roseus]|uniref:Mannosyltransferase n=1 Tax=Limnoglobus roseus TaxID=2598579 RepID=A0A5C1ACA7_9BACT|nr:hypothetical protein [Limnoglobus roseus]QEL16921.1 hypothetical protein PX52LOC_03897 [Limnoglobus roseus]
MSHFLFDYPDPLPAEAYHLDAQAWATQPAVRDAHKAALLALADRDWAYPGGEGRGVLCGGGGRLWPMTLTLCSQLREVGYGGPIECWYRGSCEVVEPRQAERFGVALRDVDAIAARVGDQRLPRGMVSPGGWESKSYAWTHTRLDEFVWLDSDLTLYQNPDLLFAELTAAPLAYWFENHFNLKWPAIGWPEPPEVPKSVQSGLIACDRRRCWKALAIAQWVCQHSDYWFRHVFSDQDALLLGMWLGGVAPHYFGHARYVPDFGVVCDYGGERFADHFYLQKLYLPSGDLLRGRLRTLRHFAAANEPI